MSRLQKALERQKALEMQKALERQKALEEAAASLPQDSPSGVGGVPRDMADDEGALGIKSFAEGVEPVERPAASHPIVTHPQPVFAAPGARAEPIAPPRIRMLRCPKCGSVYEGSLQGSLRTWFLRLMRMSPYRCKYCRGRFELSHAYQEERETVSIFLSPDDDRSFHDVIRDLARDERQESVHGFGSNASAVNERRGLR
jgi:hypothetical protein